MSFFNVEHKDALKPKAQEMLGYTFSNLGISCVQHSLYLLSNFMIFYLYLFLICQHKFEPSNVIST